MKLKDNTSVTIHSFMRTDLNLKGNDLLVYAIIYGYCQEEGCSYTGSLRHLAEWCGATKQGIMKNLNNLLELGLLVKEDVTVNNVKYCSYTTTDHTTEFNGIQQSCNNIILNNRPVNSKRLIGNCNDVERLQEKVQSKKPNQFVKCMELINDFTDDEVLREYLQNCYKRFSENAREANTPFYTNTFKGKLNKLKSLSDDNYEQREIVLQTLDNGWNNFYDLKKNTYSNKKVSSDMGYEVKRGNKKALKESIENGTAEKF